MSKICEVCGKAPSFGRSVSHSHRVTNRMFRPNIQKITVKVDGKVKRAIGTTLTVFACVALALTAGSTALCLRTGSAPFLMIGALGTLFAALGGKKGLSNLRKACKM